jgi:hypothetical protein
VLVTELGAGTFLVQGYPTGVSAYVSAAEGRTLGEVLDAAFSDVGTTMNVPPMIRPRI